MSTKTIPSLGHPFERAGLGKAPFQFTGISENVFVSPGCPPKPGGTCDYCSNGIMYEFWCRSADGKEFKVGCDCIRRLESTDNRLVAEAEKAEAKRRAVINTAKRIAKRDKDLARIRAAYDLIASDKHIRDSLAATRHPKIDSPEHSLLTYAEWMWRQGGIQGRLAICQLVENLATVIKSKEQADAN